MSEQPYTPANLRRRITFTDKCNDESLHDLDVRKKIGEGAAEKVRHGSAFCSGIRGFRLGKKYGYGFNDISDTIIARLISKNIQAAYPTTQSNRQALIGNTVSIAKECVAYNVFRYDIRQFYESIDRKLLLETIIADGICTWQTILLIQKLFELLDIHEISGLPRGLAVSGALAELRLLKFDQAIKHNNDVFFYGRFVDDILLITSERLSKASLEESINSELPDELDLHDGEKRTYLPIPAIHSAKKKNEPVKKFYELSYLGYKIRISNNTTKESVLGSARREVLVDISDNKIQKLKDRLIKSYTNYLASAKTANDISLLKNRVRAITGNYEINDPSTKITIKTGIYYSYIHKNSEDDCALLKLDSFFRGLLFSTNHSLSKRISNTLPLNDRRLLTGYSFKSGFNDRRFHSFSYKSFETIKKIWL